MNSYPCIMNVCRVLSILTWYIPKTVLCSIVISTVGYWIERRLIEPLYLFGITLNPPYSTFILVDIFSTRFLRFSNSHFHLITNKRFWASCLFLFRLPPYFTVLNDHIWMDPFLHNFSLIVYRSRNHFCLVLFMIFYVFS